MALRLRQNVAAGQRDALADAVFHRSRRPLEARQQLLFGNRRRALAPASPPTPSMTK